MRLLLGTDRHQLLKVISSLAPVFIMLFAWWLFVSTDGFAILNDESHQQRSPNGKYIAAYASRDGMPFNYDFVSVRPVFSLQINKFNGDEIGEVANGGIDSIQWTSATTLVIRYDPKIPSDDFVLKSTKWRDVDIEWIADKKA